jgi:exodeoxyribonuclease III
MKKNINIISWNINGIRAAERKGFVEWISKGTYDIICVQETKVHDPNILSKQLLDPKGYISLWNSATEKKGYSGVAIYTKEKPLSVKTDFGKNILSKEGRMLQLEFKDFILINIYFPNGGASDIRLNFKLKFYKQFLTYIKKLHSTGKHIIFCGDVNTAHHEIDLARPKPNTKNSGFMPIERSWLDKFEKAHFIDTFRFLHPDKKDSYTWWDYKTRARSRNVGWRIDYFWVNKKMQSKIKQAKILSEIDGSDHCPVLLNIDIK